MNTVVKNRLEMLERVASLVENLKPKMNLPANALHAQIVTTMETIRELARDQVSGRQNIRGAVANRAAVANELRALLRIIADAAGRLDPVQYPEIASTIRFVPLNATFTELLSFARSFDVAMQTAMPGFVDYLTQPLIDRFRSLIVSFEEGTNRRANSFAAQVGSTAALDALSNVGVKLVRELDRYVSLLLMDDPAALASYKSASRVGGRSHKAKAKETGTTVASAPAVATVQG